MITFKPLWSWHPTCLLEKCQNHTVHSHWGRNVRLDHQDREASFSNGLWSKNRNTLFLGVQKASKREKTEIARELPEVRRRRLMRVYFFSAGPFLIITESLGHFWLEYEKSFNFLPATYKATSNVYISGGLQGSLKPIHGISRGSLWSRLKFLTPNFVFLPCTSLHYSN